MTPKTSLQKSPSDTSKDERRTTVKAILHDVKKASTAKHLISDLNSGAAPERIAIKALSLLKQSSVLTKESTPEQILEILKAKFDLSTKPDIEYISHVIGGLDDLTKEKIQAVLCVHETDMASQDMHVFEKVGTAFNGRMPRFDHLMPLSIGESAWTAKCIAQIHPQDFSDEVCFYMAATAVEYGLMLMPKQLWFAQSHLEKLTGITDVGALKDLYDQGKVTTGVELYDRQLEKLLAVDMYVIYDGKV